MDNLLKELSVWDGYLSDGREYLANTFLIADIYVFPFMAPYYEIMKLPVKKYPHLAAWYERCKNRPAIKDLDFWPGLKSFETWFGDHDCALFKDLE